MQKIKTPLMLTIFLLTGGALYVLLNGTTTPANTTAATGHIKDAPDIVINTINQTAMTNGDRQWTLTAASARFRKSKEKTVFTDISLTAFAKNGPVHVIGDKGIMDMTNNNVDLFGNVRLDYGSYKIFTQTLHYQANDLIIYTDDTVRINGDSLHFTGDAMRFDMKTETAELTGNIKGRFNDNMLLE